MLPGLGHPPAQGQRRPEVGQTDRCAGVSVPSGELAAPGSLILGGGFCFSALPRVPRGCRLPRGLGSVESPPPALEARTVTMVLTVSAGLLSTILRTRGL